MALQMSWDEIVKGTLVAYVNHGLTLLAVYLGQHGLRAEGILTPENLLILAAAIVTGALSLVMNRYRAKATHNLVEAARQAEPGTAMSVIKADAATKPIL